MDQKKFADLKKQALAEAKKAEKEFKKAAAKVVSYIKENPKKAAGIAAGAALAVGAAAATFIATHKKGKKK
ncbi:MAG: hypothetical protein FJZ04_00665 [Candidatus Moranbacteria bacterium]|nr:hypothetical protein [Candidatus Moranbacteria bacterium]